MDVVVVPAVVPLLQLAARSVKDRTPATAARETSDEPSVGRNNACGMRGSLSRLMDEHRTKRRTNVRLGVRVMAQVLATCRRVPERTDYKGLAGNVLIFG